MYFTFVECDLDLIGELLYIQDEYSLSYNPWNENVEVSILCGEYTSLDAICETGAIVHISGLNSKQVWINRKLDMPVSKKGKLTVHFDIPPLKGSGVDYAKSWCTYYDKETECLCIGTPKIETNDDCIEFANGIVAVLRESQLIAIWAKIREVETV